MNNVLYIGPDYKNHRGGIGAVLEVYSRHVKPFKFVPTYVTKSFFTQSVTYLSSICKVIWLCITDRQIQILHIHHASRGSFLRKSVLFLIGKILGKKVIMHIHGGGFNKFYSTSKLRPYIRFILERSDAVITLSESWRKYYSTNFRLKRLAVVNNVIEKAALTSDHISNGTLRLLFLGHVTDKKGVFDLLEVLASGRNEFRNRVKVTIGGIGETERLERTIADNQFNGDVKFAGWVNGCTKAQLLNDCDVYILPSYSEGLPISILEAMSYGKPVISTEVGGIPEIVKPGFNGWLFKPGDKAALSGIIREAVEKKHLLQEYGNNSLKVAGNYTPESVFHSLKGLYQQILNP